MNNAVLEILLLFLSFLALHAAADAVEDPCKGMRERCLRLLKSSDFPQFPIGFSEDDFNHACTNIQSGLTCIDNYDKNCRQNVSLTRDYNEYIRAIRGAVNTLCKPGPDQTKFFNHRSCLKTTLPDLTACNAKYEETVSTLKRERQTQTDASQAQDYTKNLCCSHRTFMTCLREKTKTCGDEASAFVTNYMDNITGPLVSYICTGYTYGDCGEN